jgi:hypothetical protein
VTVATTLHRPVAIYREEQTFAWWVYVLLAAVALLGLWIMVRGGRIEANGAWQWRLSLPASLGIAVVMVPATITVGLLRMTTEVSPTTCVVWFGWLPTIQHAIPLARVSRVQVVAYRPIHDCGGWGARRTRDGMRVLSARGDRAVRVDLDDGSYLLIGTQQPAELAQALSQGIVRPGP